MSRNPPPDFLYYRTRDTRGCAVRSNFVLILRPFSERKWSGRQDCPDPSGLCQVASFLLRKLGDKDCRDARHFVVRSNFVLILANLLRKLRAFPQGENGRGDRIRTCDICVPNAALYQAELLPVATLTKAVIYGGQKLYELSLKFKSKMNILTGSSQRLQKCL